MLITPQPVTPQATAPLPAAMPVILPQGAPATARQTQAAIAGTPMAAQVAQDQRSPMPALYMGTAARAAMLAQEEAPAGRHMLATQLRKDSKHSVLGAGGAKAYGRTEERMVSAEHPEGETPPIDDISA